MLSALLNKTFPSFLIVIFYYKKLILKILILLVILTKIVGFFVIKETLYPDKHFERKEMFYLMMISIYFYLPLNGVGDENWE